MVEKKEIIASHVSRPVRKKRVITSFAEAFLPYFPELRKKLLLADMKEAPVEFLEKVIISAVVVALSLTILTGLILYNMQITLWFIIPSLIIYTILAFYYFSLYPDVRILKRQREIDYEIVFAGRHLLVALRSGMPLYDALIGVSTGYGEASKEFNKIVEKVILGEPLAQAMREVSSTNPSVSFNRLVMQIANSISSGADIAESLEVVINQIAREQVIEIKAYGQKLNPLVMFYMIFGIVLPSLGIAFAIILFSLISGGRLAGMNSTILILVFLMIVLIQFLFLAMVESSRPKYAL